MTNLTLLVKGLLIGFFTAVPIGPIGIMCIQQSISCGKRQGFISGLGAATADMLFGSIAIFGVTMISDFLMDNNLIIRATGGVMLLVIGTRIMMGRQENRPSEVKRDNMFQSYLTMLLLTLTNPMTILAYMTILALFNIVSTDRGPLSSSLLVTGIFFGSALWFSLLTVLAHVLKSRLTEKALIRLNRALGALLLIFGVFLLINQVLEHYPVFGLSLPHLRVPFSS
ncbi:MAG: LysE family transporter [Spirochaetes bacterium]|nr:LysE family transporter [Spirochaetota bacterium]